MNGLGQTDFGPIEPDKIKPGIAFDVLTDDCLFGHRSLHGIFHDQLVDFHQLRGVFSQTGFGITDSVPDRPIPKRVPNTALAR